MATPEIAPIVLCIRDGWGWNPHTEHDAYNAVHLARTPVDDQLRALWPSTLIRTSGADVGLPPGTMGNSEVGHQNIGAGRVVDQELQRISRAIRDGRFQSNAALIGAIEHAKRSGGSLHLLGLVSDGHVHSDIEHLFALIDLAAAHQVDADRLFIHAIADGRDTGPTTGAGFIERTESHLRSVGIGRIATVIGRYYAMDRDLRWERIAWAYHVLTGQPVAHPALPALQEAAGGVPAASAEAAAVLRSFYENPPSAGRVGDEFVRPTRIVAENADARTGRIQSGDAVIFFNFRGDRPRQLTRAFVLDEAAWGTVAGGGFDRGERLDDLCFCTMTGYERGLPVTAVAFEKPAALEGILGEVVSGAGLTQFRCAETEKFAHVTYFFNDYREHPFEGEHRDLLPSPKDVATYDQRPEMSAAAVCDAVLERLEADDCESLIVVNFANPDMVGHTGHLDAVIAAVETVDAYVGRILERVLSLDGAMIVTADHGNAEQMWNPEMQCVHTAHTTYDVPLIIAGNAMRGASLRHGRLADIAPTILDLMGLPQPSEMTGATLIESGRNGT